jgi:hypothetical protein
VCPGTERRNPFASKALLDRIGPANVLAFTPYTQRALRDIAAMELRKLARRFAQPTHTRSAAFTLLWTKEVPGVLAAHESGHSIRAVISRVQRDFFRVVYPLFDQLPSFDGNDDGDADELFLMLRANDAQTALVAALFHNATATTGLLEPGHGRRRRQQQRDAAASRRSSDAATAPKHDGTEACNDAVGLIPGGGSSSSSAAQTEEEAHVEFEKNEEDAVVAAAAVQQPFYDEKRQLIADLEAQLHTQAELIEVLQQVQQQVDNDADADDDVEQHVWWQRLFRFAQYAALCCAFAAALLLSWSWLGTPMALFYAAGSAAAAVAVLFSVLYWISPELFWAAVHILLWLVRFVWTHPGLSFSVALVMYVAHRVLRCRHAWRKRRNRRSIGVQTVAASALLVAGSAPPSRVSDGVIFPTVAPAAVDASVSAAAAIVDEKKQKLKQQQQQHQDSKQQQQQQQEIATNTVNASAPPLCKEDQEEEQQEAKKSKNGSSLHANSGSGGARRAPTPPPLPKELLQHIGTASASSTAAASV